MMMKATETTVFLHEDTLKMPMAGRQPPSPHEESDSSDDIERPLVLKQVLSDLLRYTDELGPAHLKVAETWNSLGLIRLHMQHNVAAAIKCHRQALEIYTAANAPTLDVAVTLNDLGRCYERSNDPSSALEIYEQAEELVRSDETIRRTHSVVESVGRAVARLRRL